jgi:hypothetical protein
MPSLLNEVYGKVAAVANVQSAFRATGIWLAYRHNFQEHHFAPAALLLPGYTAQPSSSETQNPETSLGTKSDSEDRDDSRKDEDYKPSGKRMKHFKETLQQISPLSKPSAHPRPTIS